MSNHGTVKRWMSDRGFGFIEDSASGEDVFVHQSEIQADGYRSLAIGESVEYSVTTDSSGKKKAVNVTGPGGASVQGDRGGSGGGFGGGRGGGRGGGGGFGGGFGGGRGGGGGGRGGGGGGGGGCYNCGQSGHFARECPQGGSGGGGGGRGGGGSYGGGY